MTTKTQTVRELDEELNNMILSGHMLEAFDRFYADDVSMQENTDPPREGKSVNREYEIAFLDSIDEFHGAKLLASAADEDVSFAEWAMDVTFKQGGRVQLSQSAVRRWKDGGVVSERFYYNKG